MRQVMILTESSSFDLETRINARLVQLGDRVVDIQFLPTSTQYNWPKYSAMIVYEKTADSGDKKGE